MSLGVTRQFAQQRSSSSGLCRLVDGRAVCVYGMAWHGMALVLVLLLLTSSSFGKSTELDSRGAAAPSSSTAPPQA